MGFVCLQEFDNEAESLVSSLSLNYDDEDIDTGSDHRALLLL